MDFWTLAVNAGWNEPALQEAGVWNALRSRPRDLNMLVATVIELDNHFRDQQRELSSCPDPIEAISVTPHRSVASSAPGGVVDAAGTGLAPSSGETQKVKFRSLPVLQTAGPLHCLLAGSAKRLSSSAHAGVLTGAASSCTLLHVYPSQVCFFWPHDALSTLF